MYPTITTICVCGAGTMGSGIAQTCVAAGYNTILFDVNAEMLLKGKLAIEKGLHWLEDKQKITPEAKEDMLGRIQYTSQGGDCKAELIIEAIVEKLEIKAGLFNQLAKINPAETLFATNTSSLSITLLQQQILLPNRVVGMHFFNPAPVMKLVEVVKGAQTDETAVQAIYELTKTLGKTPVICKDAPGFIVNRVARPYYLEAMKLVEQGIATIETVDALLEANGFKMGPFKLMDLIGMDINYAVSNIVYDALGKPERLKPSLLQKEKVDAGNLGRKTGKGFYDYEEGSR
ncbi:MAG: 3-hydroxyacyl-CoA dehydrogenase NAD-binding domain-containing protein [Chitinophagaceae bacterium]